MQKHNQISIYVTDNVDALDLSTANLNLEPDYTIHIQLIYNLDLLISYYIFIL